MIPLLRRFFPLIVISVFVAALWLPFGLKTTGLMEEWMSYNSYERGTPTARDEQVSFVTLSGQQRLRPLHSRDVGGSLIWLTPDSFVGMNLVALVSIIAKGLALYLVLTQFWPRQRLFALTAALLFLVFPADQGIFTFRGLHIHGAVALYLLAIYFLLRAWDRPRWYWLLLIWSSLVASIFIYEIAYPLIVFTPLLLLFRRGEPEFRKRFIRLSLIWYAAPVVTLMYAAVTLSSGATYQGWVVQHSGINQASIMGTMAQAVWNAYGQHFVGGWLDALRSISANVGFVGLAALLAVAVVALAWRMTPDDEFGS